MPAATPPRVFADELRRVMPADSTILFTRLDDDGDGLAKVQYRRDDKLEFRVGSALGEASELAQRVVAAHEVAHLALNHRGNVARNSSLLAFLLALGVYCAVLARAYVTFFAGGVSPRTMAGLVLATPVLLVLALQPYFWIERRCEHAADCHAAREFGRVLTTAIADELEELGRHNGRRMSRLAFAFQTHPSWSRRAEHVTQTLEGTSEVLHG